MIPEYSDDGRDALGTLLQNSYKLILYFEDAGKEALYDEIVQQLTTRFLDVRVICLNGKDSLLNHRQAAENRSMQSNVIYILDKDFDDHLKKKRRFRNIFYLPQYSIENLLIEEDPVLELAEEEKPGMRQLKETVGFQAFLDTVYPAMQQLAALYLIAQEHQLGLSNTSEPMQRRSINNLPWRVCENKVATYSATVFARLAETGALVTPAQYQSLLEQRIRSIRVPDDIPGKQLVELVRTHLGNVIAVRTIPAESFCFRLAKKCKFDSLHALKTIVETRLKAA